MPKIDKHVIMPLSDAILQIRLNRFDGGENDMSVEAKELAELMQDDNTMDMGVYIVTNLSKVNGASMILDEALRYYRIYKSHCFKDWKSF